MPATPLVGRGSELASLAALVEEGARLVTLTGVGGVGKTRLAVALADTLATLHPDGTVMGVVGCTLRTPRPCSRASPGAGLSAGHGVVPPESIVRHLADLRLLLVLDNFEHLLSAATLVEHLVDHCPSLRCW